MGGRVGLGGRRPDPGLLASDVFGRSRGDFFSASVPTILLKVLLKA